jgi:hypothetical protein
VAGTCRRTVDEDIADDRGNDGCPSVRRGRPPAIRSVFPVSGSKSGEHHRHRIRDCARRIHAVIVNGVSATSRLNGGAQFTSLWPLRATRKFKLP